MFRSFTRMWWRRLKWFSLLVTQLQSLQKSSVWHRGTDCFFALLSAPFMCKIVFKLCYSVIKSHDNFDRFLLGNLITEILSIWDYSVLLATRHKRAHHALTSASKSRTQFTYPGGMEGWVDLGDMIVLRPGVELAVALSRVWRPNHCTTKTLLSCQKILMIIDDSLLFLIF